MSNITNLMALAMVVNMVRQNNPKVRFFQNYVGVNDVINFFKAVLRTESPDLTGIPEAAKPYLEILMNGITSQFIQTSLSYVSNTSTEESVELEVNPTMLVDFIYDFIGALSGGEVFSKKEISQQIVGSDFFNKKEANRKIVNHRKLEKNRAEQEALDRMENANNAEQKMEKYLQRKVTLKELRKEILSA